MKVNIDHKVCEMMVKKWKIKCWYFANNIYVMLDLIEISKALSIIKMIGSD